MKYLVCLNIAFGIVAGWLIIDMLMMPSSTIPSKHWWQFDMDATDDPVIGNYSNMFIYIDYGTGCHYIATPVFGSLTPRLDRDGKQICEPKSNPSERR